jgi:peptide/nickel transport system permease protein
VPAVVIGFVYIPYVAKPIRGQVLQLREREFVDAARQQGLSHWRIMFSSEILPNLSLDDHRLHPADPRQRDPARGGAVLPRRRRPAAQPVLGHDDLRRHHHDPGRVHNVLVPGIMLVLAVLSVNVFGDGLRDALDPRAKVRIARLSRARWEPGALMVASSSAACWR